MFFKKRIVTIAQTSYVVFSPCHSNPGPAVCVVFFLCGQQEEHVCLPGAFNQISLLPQVSQIPRSDLVLTSVLNDPITSGEHWVQVWMHLKVPLMHFEMGSLRPHSEVVWNASGQCMQIHPGPYMKDRLLSWWLLTHCSFTMNQTYLYALLCWFVCGHSLSAIHS